MSLTRATITALAGLLFAGRLAAQELVLEEIVVESSFSSSLELANEKAVQITIDQLLHREEATRALELQISHRSLVTTLLDLTKYSPIPLGASDSRVDTFFLQNYLRADLNPREKNSLFSK